MGVGDGQVGVAIVRATAPTGLIPGITRALSITAATPIVMAMAAGMVDMAATAMEVTTVTIPVTAGTGSYR